MSYDQTPRYARASRATGEQERRTEDKKKRGNWFFRPQTIIGILIMLSVLVFGPELFTWGQNKLDDFHYGYPRTTQCDAVIGHNDSAENPSHFIATNLNRKVTILEFPGGEAQHIQRYEGPLLLGSRQDLVTPFLEFKDLNGDKKPEMILRTVTITIYINTGKSFRSLKSGENFNL